MIKETVIVCALVFVGPGPRALGQTARVKAILPQFQSSDPGVREQAFDQLSEIPHVIAEPGVGPALVSLLKLEEANYDADAPFVNNEDWASYYSLIRDAVFSYVKLTSDLSPLPLVINQPANTGSLGELEVAKLGAAAIPALVEVEANGDAPGKEQAVDVVGIMLQRDRAGTQPLPAEATATLRRLLHSALEESNSIYVRLNAVQQIGHIGDPADMALLQKLTTDPKVDTAAKRAIERFGQRSRDIVGPGSP